MNFGTRTNAAESKKIIERALDRGVTFFDTANMYGNGESERIVGEALSGRRDQVQIATKVGLLKNEGLGKARIIAALDESLKRLKTDVVDVFYLHSPDPKTPIVESIEAMATLLQQKKIRSWAVSNYASWQVLEMNLWCDQNSVARPVRSQLLYNLLIRQLDVEYFAFAKRFPIHTTVYNPLAGGLLARVPEVGGAVPKGSRFDYNARYKFRYWHQPMIELTQQLAGVAKENGLSLVTLAYAWLVGRAGVDSVIAGPGSIEHLDAAVDGCAVRLSDEVRKKIDELHAAYLGTDAKYAR